jgi:hypothetical protein
MESATVKMPKAESTAATYVSALIFNVEPGLKVNCIF